MELRNIVNRIPETKRELSDYITKYYSHVKEAVAKNPQYKDTLDEAVKTSFEKYSRYLGGLTSRLNSLGHVVGYTADAWLLSTGDIIGSLGLKFFNLLSQIPEKAYSLVYGVSTGNYLDAAQNVLEGLISYVPGLTFVDQGLSRILRKRIVRDALTSFEKEVGIYKPWTTKLADRLSKVYTGVKDRIENVFTPKYEPMMSGLKTS